MRLDICQYEVNGYIEILEHRESCRGEIDEEGFCKLYGCIVTLMQKINYIASGVINENEVSLMLHGEGQRDAFHIIGKACSSAGGEPT